MKKIIAGLLSVTMALGCIALPAEVTEKLVSGSVITASAESEGGFPAYLMFTDANWGWGNWGVNDGTEDGGKGTDAFITGDGTYTVSISADQVAAWYDAYGNVVEAGTNGSTSTSAIGAIIFCVDIPSLADTLGANTKNFDDDASAADKMAFVKEAGLTISNVKITVDGAEAYVYDDADLLYGDLEGRGSVRIEIYNEYGDTKTSAPESVLTFIEKLYATDSIAVTFDISIDTKTINPCRYYDYTILDDGTVEIIDYFGCESTVTVPDTINEKKVTSIGDYAFHNCKGITSITIPNTVTHIGDDAFSECTSLANIIIPNSVSNIGKYAFSYCSSLASITIPSSVTSIGVLTFVGCTYLSSIIMPASVNTIGDSAFYDCSNLKNVYYTGSETDWGKIDISDNNTYLTDATIHYNYVPTVTVPDAKISQSYTSTGTSITVNWGKLDGVTGYIVYRYDGINKKWLKVKTVTGADTTSATVTGFTPGSVIKFKVNAYITDGGKTYYGKTNDFLYAAALGDAKISSDYSSTGTSFTLNWGKVQGATGYKVYKYNGSTGKWVLAKTVTGANTTSATVSGYTQGSVIKFKVNAYLTKGSKTYYGKTNDFLYAAALAPASFKSSYTATTTTAAVSWGKVTGATGYKIYKYDSANKKWVLAKTITSASTTSATVTGLTSGTTTKLKINAYLTKGTKTYYGKAGTMLSVTTK